MEKFKYKFSVKLYIAMAAGTVLAVACLILNIIRLIKLAASDAPLVYDVISVAVAIVMSVGFIVIVAALFIDSSYVFGEKMLTVKFGIIRTSVEYKKIKQIVWFKANDKLTVFYDDESFGNIVISSEFYNGFVSTLLSHRPEIVYYEDLDEK